MVAVAKSYELGAVGHDDVQAVRLRLVPKSLPLQLYHRPQRLPHRIPHLDYRILPFPCFLAFTLGQKIHVQRCEMLRIRTPLDIRITVIVHQLAHIPRYLDKVRNSAVVHDGVAAKDEGMIVDRGNCGGGCGADMGEDGSAGGVGADGAEVCIVERGLGVFIEGGAEAGEVVEFGLRAGVLSCGQ